MSGIKSRIRWIVDGASRLWRNSRGAAAVEFAFVAPAFLMLTFGGIEIGRAMFLKASMQYAVEEAARYAMINTSATNTQIQNYAKGSLFFTSQVNGMTIVSSSQTVSGVTYVTITATYAFQSLAPYLPFNVSGGTLNAKARVPIS